MRRCLKCMQEYQEILSQCPHCGYSPEEQIQQKELFPLALPVETILMGRYILGCLHRHDVVFNLYNAWDALLEKKVFLREYLPEGLCERNEEKEILSLSKDAGINRFEYGRIAYEEETDRLIRNQDVNGTIPLYRIFREKGTTFAVSEYSYDDTLEEILEREQMIPVEKVERLLGILCNTVDELHGRGIFHWNICPSSIYVDDEWNGRLTDYGYAKAKISRFLPGNASFVSIYTAPEFLTEDGASDGLADLFSLGVIGKELYQRVRGLPIRKRAQIKKALNRASHTNKKKRPKSGAELAEWLLIHYDSGILM